jgi:SAM-dependent MidA family methyltransferase
MAVSDVLRALDAMHDPDLRRALADGRLEQVDGLADHELDNYERELVRAAAAGYPEGDLGTFAELAGGLSGGAARIGAGWFGAYGEAVRYTDSAYTEAWDGAPELGERPPTRRAEDPSEVIGAPSFAAYADRCLYDPADGYYSTGAVHFGTRGHFWTYPDRMSPLFGIMVAESLRTIFDEWTWDGRLADVDPLTILELGGGDGHLAGDVLDHVWDDATETWEPYRDGLRYVLGDRSPALRRRQLASLRRHHRAGRVEVRPLDAVELSWDGPFRGAVVANELLDALAHECLRVDEDGTVVRVHVRETPEGRHELEVPLAWGWFDQAGVAGPPPPDLPEYLGRAVRIVEEVRDAGAEPADLYWAPGLPTLIARLGELLRRPGSLGVALLIDYGDATVEGIDTDESRLRVYAEDQVHGQDPYRAPGESDLTWDVDFGEVGRLARRHGLAVRFAGPQSALEVPPVDLLVPAWLDRLVPGRTEEGALDPAHALAAALALVAEFRNPSGGYRVMMLSPADLPFPVNAFGPRQRLG